MTEPLRVPTFGGCMVHNPQKYLFKINAIAPITQEMGFRWSPVTQSATAHTQLLAFMLGEIDLPAEVRKLIYVDWENQPRERGRAAIANSEVALVELSTPVEYSYEGYVFNLNRLEDVLMKGLTERGVDSELIGKWRRALRNSDEEARLSFSDKLCAVIPNETAEEQFAYRVIRDARSRMVSEEEMEASVAQLRDRLGVPMGMVLYNFQYLPDGRPVSWPAWFKGACANIADRLGMPRYDYAPVVAERGVETMLLADMRHWSEEAHPIVAEKLYDFAAGLIDRPPLASVLADRQTQSIAAE